MAQRWERLAFLHWPVDAAELRAVLPPGIEPDVYDGSAWIGITPFEVHNFRLRFTPPLPVISHFPEINVRTYVTGASGKPGIWFLSLDTSSALAVQAARRTYRLPYHRAKQAVRRRHGWIEFASRRKEPAAALAARYRPTGPPRVAEPGAFEHFVAERYCLYTVDDSLELLRGDIRHRSWPLQPAELELAENSMARPYGIALDGEPRVHFAECVDVVFWPLERD